jgi:hypothetical protein
MTNHVNAEADMQAPPEPTLPAVDLNIKLYYDVLISTRNLEINLFWQRSNYFLALNSALAIGFFNLKGSTYGVLFVGMGILSSLLWFRVCLGAKYWQSRWEQRLMDFERHHFPGLDFFSANGERIQSDARRSFGFHKIGRFKRLIYNLALAQRPSVSFSMILLSIVFMAAWVIALLLFVFVTNSLTIP